MTLTRAEFARADERARTIAAADLEPRRAWWSVHHVVAVAHRLLELEDAAWNAHQPHACGQGVTLDPPGCTACKGIEDMARILANRPMPV